MKKWIARLVWFLGAGFFFLLSFRFWAQIFTRKKDR